MRDPLKRCELNLRWSIVFASLVCILLVASLQIILLAEFSGVITEQVWLTTSDGIRLNAIIYRAVSTSEPKPGIVICHGFLASHQTMQSYSLSFAKRGFLVVSIDLHGHGDSEGSLSIGTTRNQNFGDDDYVEVADDPSLDLQKEFTLSAWINAGGGVDQVIINKEDSYQDRNFKLCLSENGALGLRFSSSSNDLDGNVTANMDLRNAGWKYIVGVYNGTYCYLFLDGEFQASDPTVGTPEGVGADLWIGRGSYAGSQREFNGTIDEVQISDIARSTAWIKASYESGRDHFLYFWSNESEADSGWLVDWDKRIRITIDHNNVDNTLSNFPVLVSLGTSSGCNNADVSHVFDELANDNNRKKIAVTTSDGVTQCYVEIEKWDNINEKAWLWVKVPSINALEDTVLYLYYDKNHIDNTDYVGDTDSLSAENVWDDNFKLVIHMNDDLDAIHVRDSTSNNNDGTKKFSPYEVAGKIGKAQHFGVRALLQRGIISIGAEINLDVRAGVDYLLGRADVDHNRIAVLGHSLGGSAVFREGFSNPMVKSVVAIAPASWIIMNSTSPKNLLLAVGDRDNIVRETSVLNLLRLTTGGGEEIGKIYGNFSQGNARKLIVSLGTDHAGEMFDPKIMEEAIDWVETSLGIDSILPVAVSSWHNIFFPLSVTASLLSVFLAIVCVRELGRFFNRGKLFQKIRPTQMGIGRLVFFYLLSWGIALSAFLVSIWMFLARFGVEGVFLENIWPFSWIPVVFAGHLMVIYVVASIMLLLAIIVFRRASVKLNLSLLEVKKNLVLGGLGFLVIFSVLNVVFTRNFIDLFPTTREFSLMMILLVFYLPLTFLEEVWLRDLQHRLSSNSWQKLGIPVALYLLPRVIPLAFATLIFGDFVLFASALLIIPALFTSWLFNKSENVAAGAIFNALFSSWIIAVVLPFAVFY